MSEKTLQAKTKLFAIHSVPTQLRAIGMVAMAFVCGVLAGNYHYRPTNLTTPAIVDLISHNLRETESHSYSEAIKPLQNAAPDPKPKRSHLTESSNSIDETSDELEVKNQSGDPAYALEVKRLDDLNNRVKALNKAIDNGTSATDDALNIYRDAVSKSMYEAVLIYAAAYSVQCGKTPDAKTIRAFISMKEQEGDPLFFELFQALEFKPQDKSAYETAFEKVRHLDCRFN